MGLLLWIERELIPGSSSGAAAGGGGTSAFNVIFIVLFALFISYLALRLSGRGKK